MAFLFYDLPTLLLIPAIILALGVQHLIKSIFAEYCIEEVAEKLT